MAVVSFQQIKDISEKNKETHIIDLGYVDVRLKGINIPIKVKSLEETLKIKNETQLDREKLTIEYKPFSRLPKQLKEVIIKDDTFRNVTPNTYVQLIKLDEDKSKLERIKYRERLFSSLIHLDMEYKTEEGKTMWEDAGIPEKDYNKLVDLFSDIIQYEIHLEIFEVIIDSIRNGNTSEEAIQQSIGMYSLRKSMENLSDEEKKEYLGSLLKAQATLDELQQSIKEQEDNRDSQSVDKVE